MFRKCRFEELGTSKEYDTEFHNRDAKRNFKPVPPLAFGMIIFYQTDQQKKEFYEKYVDIITYTEVPSSFNYDSDDSDESSDVENIFNSINNPSDAKPISGPSYTDNMMLYKYIHSATTESGVNIRDFGKSYYRNFDDILKLFDVGLLSVEYCSPHILEEYNNNEFLSSQGKTHGSDDCGKTIDSYTDIIKSGVIETGEKIVGYLPWKMLVSDIIHEPRDETYIYKYAAKIQEVMVIIKKLNETDDHDEKMDMFKKYYPKSKVLKESGLDNTHVMEFLPRGM